jgi:pimeloyl-ACP methyl ester carboxylesterase
MHTTIRRNEVAIPRALRRLGLTALLCALVLAQPASLLAQGGTVPARPTPRGRLVDIGGYRLHLYCTGSGSPTVVLMHGFADFSFTWALVQSGVAQVTRVCSYDRAGQAWSDPGPPPRGLQRISDELHTLLERSGEPGPFILVGQSWGGLIPRLYQPLHPADVVGIVFVDASHEDMWMWLNGVTLQPGLASAAEWERIHQPRARRGPPPLVDSVGGPPRSGPPVAAPSATAPAAADTSTPALQPPYDQLPPEARRWHAWARSIPPVFTGGDWADIRADLIAVRAARGSRPHPLGAVPVVVLSAGKSDFENEPEASAAVQRMQHDRGQADLAALSSNSRQITATSSGHHIQLDEPDIVVEAIRQVIDAVRSTTLLCCRP